MSIDVWASEARRKDWHQHHGDQRAIDVLESVFEGKISPEDGANAIAAIYEPLLKSKKSEPNSSRDPWELISEALTVLGGDQKIDLYVIDLINALQCRPAVVDHDGNTVKAGAYGGHGIYWRELGFLARTLYDSAFEVEADLETGEKPDEADYTDTQKASLMNITTFGALYINFGKADIHMIHRASDSLRDVMAPYQRSEEEQRRAPTLIPPAATWILIAGKSLYDFCKNGIQDEDSRRCYPMTLERWTAWKIGFGEIATIEALGHNVRDIASRAANEMKRIG